MNEHDKSYSFGISLTIEKYAYCVIERYGGDGCVVTCPNVNQEYKVADIQDFESLGRSEGNLILTTLKS